MLCTFKSPATSDLLMFENDSRTMLEVFGKDPGSQQGVITVEQLPGAITALRRAIEADNNSREAAEPQAQGNDEDIPDEAVRFAQRALPLLEMLERSLTQKVPVTWGV